jgi:hypothetical protein
VTDLDTRASAPDDDPWLRQPDVPERTTLPPVRLTLGQIVDDQTLQPMPPMLPGERDALRDTMRGVGPDNLDPITVDERNRVLDGHHRLQLARELNWTYLMARTRVGFSEAENYEYALSTGLVRRHLNRKQKHNLLEDAIRRLPHLTDHALAALCHTDHKTITSTRRALEAVGEIPQQARRVGRDGKVYAARRVSAATQRQLSYDWLTQTLESFEIHAVDPQRIRSATRGLDRQKLHDRLYDFARSLLEIADALEA